MPNQDTNLEQTQITPQKVESNEVDSMQEEQETPTLEGEQEYTQEPTTPSEQDKQAQEEVESSEGDSVEEITEEDTSTEHPESAESEEAPEGEQEYTPEDEDTPEPSDENDEREEILNEDIAPTPPSQSTQDATNLVELASEELKQSGITLEEIIDTPPQIQITTSPYPIDKERLDRLNAFEEKLNNTLADSLSFREHTRLNLEGLSELYKISKDIYSFYEVQISTLLVSNTDTEHLRQEIAQVAVFINQTLETIQTATNTTLTIYKKCEASLDLATQIYTKLDTRAQEMDKTLEAITSIQAQMQDLQELELNFRVLITKGEELRNQINALVPNILNDVKATLLDDKLAYEKELESQKDDYLSQLSAQYAKIQQTIEDFNIDFAKKELKVDESLQRIDTFLADLVIKTQEVATTHAQNIGELSSLSEAKKEEFEEIVRAKKEEYNTYTANLQTLYTEKSDALTAQHTHISTAIKEQESTTLDTITNKRDNTYVEVDNKIETGKGDLSTHYETLQNDLENLWTQYQNRLDSLATGEIAQIKQNMDTIASNLSNYGLSHQRTTFTANGTYTAPEGILYVYAFVQGGTGNGVASSFGSYVSASGGTGGGSQRGQCASGFFKLSPNAKVNVVVGAGGCVIVSTATKV